MRKLFVATLLMGTTAMAYGQFTGDRAKMMEGDIVSPYVTSTVAAVRQMPDETYVTVEGYILQQQGHDKEKYLFRDASGEILIEVDKKIWRNQPITPDTTVKILGELDQSRQPDRVKIEVVYLEVIQ